MKRILFLASLLVGLALAFAPIEAPRVAAQTFPGQTSPGYIPIGQGAAPIKWLPITGCSLTSPGAMLCPTTSAIDVFLVIGDSQAVGQGTSPSSPPVPGGQVLAYCANGTIVTANDPTCSAVNAAQNANTGSMWPAAGIAYGRRVGFVLTGVSGSTQATACDLGVGNGNWQSASGGSNYANALAAINSALTAYTAGGYTPTFRGIIYVLGNNDGVQIDNSVCTAANYTAGLTAMVANWRAATIGGTTYPHLKFWLPIIGTNVTSGISDSGYSQVRAAQIAFAAGDGNVSVPFTDLYSMAARGYIQTNSVHLNQAGLNIMGSAIGFALIPGITANIPYQLFSQNAGIGGAAPAGTIFQMIGADAASANALLDAYAGVPLIQLRRGDTTLQAPSAVQSGEPIGTFGVQSFGATTFGSSNQGALLFSATQNHTDSAKGTQACIYTTANGAATPTCNLQVGQDGQIQITSAATFNWNADTYLSRAAAATIHLGQADAASPVSQTLGVQNVVGGTSNMAGVDWIIAGSQGTGTGAGGNIRFKAAPAGLTGSTQNALADVMQVYNTQRVNIGGNFAPDAIFTINQNTGVTSVAAPTTAVLHTIAADSAIGQLDFDTFGAANTAFGLFVGRGSGGTRASPTAMPAAAYVFNIQGQGYDGVSNFGGLADIGILTINQTSTSDHSGQIKMRTTATSSTTLTQRLLIDQGIIIGTGSTDPGANTVAITGQTFASLAGSPVTGTVAYVTDGLAANCGDTSCTTWGTTVTGGTGALKLFVWYDGSHWTLMGK